MGWRWHDGDGDGGLGDIPDLAGRGGGGGEGAHCATRRVVQSRCHTEEVEPGRFVRKCEKTERLLRDCVGRPSELVESKTENTEEDVTDEIKGIPPAVSVCNNTRKDERTWTTDTYAPYDDGHQWRKYGEKKLSNSSFPRFYYRCTYKNDMKCPATKQIQQKDTNDPPLYSVTYFNQHTCNSSSRPIGNGSSSDIPARSSSRKAVSICFKSQATSEQPTFLTSSATLQSPSAHSFRANQQPDSSTSYTRQFQWADTSSSSSNAPVKMEVDGFAGASTSSNTTTGALSRTLLPIGQSRCIEFFHFL